MSRATDLAVKCGAKSDIRLTWYDKVSDTKQEVTNLFGVFMTSQQIEAFYHAARAEALREAAEKYYDAAAGACDEDYSSSATSVANDLSAMADREGK